MSYKIIYCGTPDFAIPPLNSLIKDKDFQIQFVISQPDKKFGRKQEFKPTDVKKFAVENALKVLQPEKIEEIKDEIKEADPDVLVVVAYGQKIPESILKIPKFGCINIHASLLPKYRGATPIQSALLNGETETGITIFKLVEKLDAGDIISMKKIPIKDEDTSETLFEKISDTSGEFLIDTLKKYLDKEIVPVPQEESDATFCHKIKREDGLIKFKLETSSKIFNKYRAFTPWPGIFTHFNNKRLKLLEIKASDENIETEKGKTVQTSDNKLAVQCMEGSILIEKLQLEGKKPQNITEFLKGNSDIINYSFE